MAHPHLNLKKRSPAVLVLEDGSLFRGWSFGHENESGGEVVFNTSMTGYQEILTDPSYFGQIVTMTYPLIGNYGVNKEDIESRAIQVAGFVLKEPSLISSNWRSELSLEEWMESQHVVGLCGIDTRALVRKLRIHGVMRGVVCPEGGSHQDLLDRVARVPSMLGADLASQVTAVAPYVWSEPLHLSHRFPGTPPPAKLPLRVVAYDFGIKYNILRHLAERVEEVQVVPAATTADEVLAFQPDGIFLSNGPGDPEPVTYAAEQIRNLLGKKPIFGICLGHQILGIALGGKTYKLKFGHRGGNQPVKDLDTGKIDITSQNHGFAVDTESLEGSGVRVTHINLNDKTVEGLECRDRYCFSVQYHPEASPGPHDAAHHFDRFMEMMKKEKGL
ncbi:MAG: glutamine-hydrolyzing carbamoyl-phosphate synthase small subunit [bacterium]|jgi:carbamoyl-phosphate synthase small subunit|nr:glutamine-hydrolyzing carbamoyl-phosphate synthase small subunit [bacterium]